MLAAAGFRTLGAALSLVFIGRGIAGFTPRGDAYA